MDARSAAWSTPDKQEDDQREDLDQYQERVDQRILQKKTDLQVRGVTAHCEDLWRSAKELEHGDQPPRPEFLLENYYTKARDMATAAHGEYPDEAKLDGLFQKAERLLKNRHAYWQGEQFIFRHHNQRP